MENNNSAQNTTNETKETIDLDNPEFQNLERLISFTHQSIFLTGKAGTGKSTFLRYIKNNTAKKYVVLAPTGIAAVNVGGQTLHSFFKIPLKPILPDDPDFAVKRLRDRMKYTHDHIKLLQELELIIIDEISMVRADIIDFIDKILRVYCKNMRQPFAGKQMLFVGDIFQLEPVITGDTRDILRMHYQLPYFFNADVFNEFSLVPIELRKVYRQSENNFINLLDRVRIGHPTSEDIAAINARVSNIDNNAPDKMTMTIATRRDIVDSINDSRLDALPGAIHSYTGEIKDDFPMNSIPTDMTLDLKIGAQVVFIKNDIHHRWVNGTIGRIKEFSKDSIIVETEDNVKHNVERERWSNIKYTYDEEKRTVIEEEIGCFIQFPLKLAWALTIHKSQGLTFNNIIIDVGRGAFTGGQSYVALSRCTSLEGISLRSTINERDIWVHPAIVTFSKTFNNDELLNEALEFAKADNAYATAAKQFNARNFKKAIDAFVEAENTRPEMHKEPIKRLIARKLNIINKLEATNKQLQQIIAEKDKIIQNVANQYITLAEQCCSEMEAYDAAIANYDNALELVPNNPHALLGKARALIANGERDDAIACLKLAATANPSDYTPALELGNLYIGMGAPIDAVDWLLNALSKNENRPEIHRALSEAYKLAGDEENAHKHKQIAKSLRNKKRPNK
jgi:tetratricopeptide (TPR) repeat protein